ncbi:hypothetical protein LZ31DRAFT_558479, partial [Colletotrichum somersetense]
MEARYASEGRRRRRAPDAKCQALMLFLLSLIAQDAKSSQFPSPTFTPTLRCYFAKKRPLASHLWLTYSSRSLRLD